MKISLICPVLVALMVFALLAFPAHVRSQAESVTIAFQDDSAHGSANIGTADVYRSQNIRATNYSGNSSPRVDREEPVDSGNATATSDPTATDTPVAASAPSPAPKYVILFIGDGMGFEHVRAAGLYNTGSVGDFSFESFPCRGELRTRSASSSVTDSAASATALATGGNVYNDVISVANPGDGRELPTLLERARAAGRKTGLITTSFMTDATTAAFAAHELSRTNTAAIAADFLNQTRPNVMLGGGGSGLTPESAASAGYRVIEDRTDAIGLSGLEQYVSGQFTTTRMPYEYDGMGDYPHLSEMTSIALNLLDDDPDGFFLMVEGGLIDQAGHANHLQRDVAEVIELDNAVRVALNWAEGRSDTLIIVTADHETGGLLVTGEGGAPGVYPSVTWSTITHTTKNVPIYAIGANASGVYGVMDNEDVPAVINGLRRVDVSFLPMIKNAIR